MDATLLGLPRELQEIVMKDYILTHGGQRIVSYPYNAGVGTVPGITDRRPRSALHMNLLHPELTDVYETVLKRFTVYELCYRARQVPFNSNTGPITVPARTDWSSLIALNEVRDLRIPVEDQGGFTAEKMAAWHPIFTIITYQFNKVESIEISYEANSSAGSWVGFATYFWNVGRDLRDLPELREYSIRCISTQRAHPPPVQYPELGPHLPIEGVIEARSEKVGRGWQTPEFERGLVGFKKSFHCLLWEVERAWAQGTYPAPPGLTGPFATLFTAHGEIDKEKLKRIYETGLQNERDEAHARELRRVQENNSQSV